MSQAKGSGIFNAQFAGEYKKHRNRSFDEERRAQQVLSDSYDQAIGYQQPFYDYGQNALKRFTDWEANPNSFTSDPSYQWRLGQGTQALENSAAARGGLLSGNTGKALTDYGQHAASQEYQNEFMRWLSRLGIGQGAAANMSNLQAGKGNALGGLIQKGSQNMWGRVVDTNNMIAQGEQGTNNIVQSWVPSMYGGGNPGQNPNATPASGAGGGGGGGGSGYGGNSNQYALYSGEQPFSQWQNSDLSLNWGGS